LPFLSVTRSVADEPGDSSLVFLPLIEKSCGSVPLFVTLKTTTPAFTDFGRSVILNSFGLPSVTVTVVALAAECCADAGSAHARTAATATMASTTTRFLLISWRSPFPAVVNVRRKVKQRLAAVAALAAALALAPTAGAHARLVATEPQQGAVVARAPAQATFGFDEPVTEGGDATLEGGPLAGKRALPTHLRAGGRVLAADLPRLADGEYVLTWKVVSDDGHRETGALAFGVGVGTRAPAPVVAERTQGDRGLGIARWLFLAGVLSASGLAAVRLALGRRRPLLAAVALAACLAAAGFGALLELARLPGVLDTRFGSVTAAAAGIAFAGVVAALLALNLPRALPVAEAAAIALVLAPPLAGHALAHDRPVWLALPADLLHTAAAAIWVGGVLWVGLLAFAGGLAGAAGFARVAAVAVVLLAASGAARAAAELTSPDELWTTRYGRLLLVKTALFACLLAVGRASARLLERASPAGLRRSIVLEGAVLAALVAAVAGLASATPPRNAPAPLVPALPGAPVVFGRQAGDLAVGIAAAARDGRLGVEATVLGPDGLPAEGIDVAVAAGGPWQPLQPCGPGRYCGGAAAAGAAPRARLRVRGHVLAFHLPERPRHALARRVLRAAAVSTRELRTVVIRERLASDPRRTLVTVFTIRAPDQMRYRSTELEGGRATEAGAAVVIGGTRWDRSGAAGGWVRSALQPLDQPVPDWRVAVDPSVLGTGTVDGRPVWWVSFRDPTVPAWLEAAIDRRTSRPLRVRMTAAAHFMLRDWGSFDEPVTISPPR
jgi:copper transport protein